MSTSAFARQTPNMRQKKYILAVDIERTGADFKYGVWAIGACFGTEDGTVLSTMQCAKRVQDEVDYDAKTWSEFWSKLPEVRARINTYAQPQFDHIVMFRDWLQVLQATYGPFGRKHQAVTKLSLASDNPAYDFGHIMLAFKERGFERGVAEMFDDYVPTDDPSEQEAALSPTERDEARSRITAQHTHEPVEDARAVFQHLCGVRRVLADRRLAEVIRNSATLPARVVIVPGGSAEEKRLAENKRALEEQIDAYRTTITIPERVMSSVAGVYVGKTCPSGPLNEKMSTFD